MRRIIVITTLVLLAICGGLTQTGENPRVAATYSSLVAEGSAQPTARPVLLTLAVTPEPTPVPTTKPTTRPATAKPVVHTTTTTKPKLTAAKPAAAKVKPAATPKPKPKATPAPQRSTTFNKDDVKRRIAATWDGDDEKALRVVGCETASTYNPAMTSANGQYFGLWQFDMDTWRRSGGSGDPRDASVETQTQIAWKLFSSRGWGPWPYCSTH